MALTYKLSNGENCLPLEGRANRQLGFPNYHYTVVESCRIVPLSPPSPLLNRSPFFIVRFSLLQPQSLFIFLILSCPHSFQNDCDPYSSRENSQVRPLAFPGNSPPFFGLTWCTGRLLVLGMSKHPALSESHERASRRFPPRTTPQMLRPIWMKRQILLQCRIK